jgi:uncharacterized protein (TIGR03083 family)
MVGCILENQCMDEPREPDLIEVSHLLIPDREALVELLAELEPSEWTKPTVCRGWDVRDVALHIVGGDFGNIAIRRDDVAYLKPTPDEDLVSFVNRINSEWVVAARRLTPRLIQELLRFTAQPIHQCLTSVDRAAVDANVSWASPDPVPRWLDVAREYMERWVHQQHIRDAVGRPGQDGDQFVAPVIAASMFALPIALQAVRSGPVVVHVEGPGGGSWVVRAHGSGWKLFTGDVAGAAARLRIEAGDWWRTVTLGLTVDEALARAYTEGDRNLARSALGAVAIIA